METSELIDILAADAAPVRPLTAPWLRTSVWFLISGAYIAILIVAMSHGGTRLLSIRFSRFWLEQAAAIGTGIAAAAAAALSVIPGRSRRWPIVPAFPLTVWLGILASGCMRDWAQHGAAGLMPQPDWPCSMAMLFGAALPAAALTFSVRRGAPLAPATTAALIGLAAGALSSVVACVSRPMPHPTTMTVVVWHLGTLFAMAVAVSVGGRSLLPWPLNPRLAAAIENRSVRAGRAQ
jgi:hypothetical protein